MSQRSRFLVVSLVAGHAMAGLPRSVELDAARAWQTSQTATDSDVKNQADLALTEDWRAHLSPAELGRRQYLRARLAHRKGLFEQTVQLTNEVVPQSPTHARALYLQAMALANSRFPNGRKNVQAIAAR